MDATDAGIIAGAFALAMAVVKMAELAIKTAVAKRNGSSTPPIDHLIDIARDQLSALRALDKEVAAIRGDLRAASIEQAHLQKTVDALHSRMNALTPGRANNDDQRNVDARG